MLLKTVKQILLLRPSWIRRTEKDIAWIEKAKKMIPIIMMLFGISTLGQFQLEIRFLPAPNQLFVKKWMIQTLILIANTKTIQYLEVGV